MKASRITKKTIIAGLALAGLAIAPALHANVEVFLLGGSASQSVLYDRATNFFNGGTLTIKGAGSSAGHRRPAGAGEPTGKCGRHELFIRTVQPTGTNVR
jgi:hypothetical protein